MSMDNKHARKMLDEAYKKGITKERARILWLMEDERSWLRKKLNKVLLVEATRHAMQVKIKIATSIYEQLKMRIMAGHEAPLYKRPELEEEKPVNPDHVTPKALKMIDDMLAKTGTGTEKNICPKCGMVGYRYAGSCPKCDDLVSGNAPRQDPVEE